MKNNKSKEVGVDDLARSLGKSLPHNIEAEEALLGAVLIEKNAMPIALEIISSKSFYKESHRVVFETCEELFSKAHSIDLLTVTNELRKKNELDLVGGPYYLVELTQRVSSAANLEFHSRIISENFLKRELIKVSSGITRESFDYGTDVHELLDKFQSFAMSLVGTFFKRKARSLKDLSHETIKAIEDAISAKKSGKLTGLPTGYTELDALTGGLQKKRLIIIAARPGMEKSVFLLNILANARKIIGNEFTAAVFLLEMGVIEGMMRLISAESGISASAMGKGRIDNEKFLDIQSSVMNLYSDNVFLDDEAYTLMEIRAKCTNIKIEKGRLDMIGVDFIQIMEGASGGNREQEIAKISRGLKKLSKDLDVPVIAISSLSRKCEDRPNKRPLMSDLRESGSIESDADMIMMLYRDKYYNKSVERDVLEVDIAKNRGGALEVFELKSELEFSRFSNIESLNSLPTWQPSIFPTDYTEPKSDNPF